MRIDAALGRYEYPRTDGALRPEKAAERVSCVQDEQKPENRLEKLLDYSEKPDTAANLYDSRRDAPETLVFWERKQDTQLAPGFLAGTASNIPAPPTPPGEDKGAINPAGDLRAQKTDGPSLNTDTSCKTCESRKYQDESDDSGVSFQMAGHIGRNESASVVMGHEREHERRETADAEDNGMKVVATRVQVKMSQCPECHKAYAAGGETQVLKTKDNQDLLDAFSHLREGRYPNDKDEKLPDAGTILDAAV